MITTSLLLFVGSVLVTPSVWALSSTGLELSVAGDLVTEIGVSRDSQAADNLRVRGIELMFYAPVDHLWDAVVSAAAHEEEGQTLFEVHEAFIGSSRLVPRLRFRVGQFFLGLGRLNRFHQHDWPIISAPEAHRLFLDKEGVIDKGGELTYLLPTPYFMELTVGLASGYNFGHAHSEGEKPLVPTHYARLSHFVEWQGASGMETGLNALRRKSADLEDMYLFGVDWTAKWQRGRRLIWLTQAEVWQRSVYAPSVSNQESVGGYIYNQYAWHDQWAVGLRLDGLSDLNRRDALGSRQGNLNYAVVPTLHYLTSEFSRVSMAYTHFSETQLGKEVGKDHRLELQWVFTLGSHPAHSF